MKNTQRFHDFENQGGSEISRAVLKRKETTGEEPPGNASYPQIRDDTGMILDFNDPERFHYF